MITTEANSRTTPQRRSSGRPARGTRRTGPAIEGLEDRRLLSISITEFPIPTANSFPIAIAAGPDGNIWFTEPTLNQVARINPTTHVITEFPEPAGTGPLDSLVAAPDGFLYAVGSSNIATSYDPVSPLVQINPANGAMTTVFSLSDATNSPGTIAVGPDGNLWFAEFYGIGELNLTTRSEHDYTNGPLFSSETIAKGPDGLWFTDGNDSEIGRIDATTDAIVEYHSALADYNAALRLDPNLSSSLYGRGMVKLKKGDRRGGTTDIAAAKAIQADIGEELARYGMK